MAKPIIIDHPEDHGWRVTVGERYVDELTWDEMLGIIAEITHPKINASRYLMFTADEWAKRLAQAGGGDG